MKMINNIKLSDGFRRSFFRQVLLPLVAILLLTFTGAGMALFLGISLTNNEARQQQQRMIEASFSQSLSEHLRQLRSLSRWAPLAQHLEQTQTDVRWLDNNIGQWLFEMFDHQIVMVLDKQNRVLRMWRDGQAISPESESQLVQDVLLSALVQKPAHPDQVDYVQSGNRAAALAVGDIQRDSQPGEHFRLISLKFLDDRFLAGLAERNQLQGLHFSDGTPRPGTVARYLIISQQGEPVGYLNWIPSRPGAQMLRAIGPRPASRCW